MNRIVRKRIEMAECVKGFIHEWPLDDEGHASVVALLLAAIARLHELAIHEEEGRTATRSAALRRRAIRRRVHHSLLRHLVTVAAGVDAERPGFAAMFRLPSGNATTQDFRALARTMLERGMVERDLLRRHGLGTRLLEDLGSALDELDATLIKSNNGGLARVEARAELKLKSDEVMRLVSTLDGIYRYRFEGNAALLTAWDSARRVVADPRPSVEPQLRLVPDGMAQAG